MTATSERDLGHLLAGTPYRAVARLGAGGMGEIYEAVGADGERVVVKLLRVALLSQADMVDRMRVEGEALALLRHPNVVAGRGHGTTSEGRPYVAMERLVGSTLQAELRKRGALPIAQAIHHTRRLLSALDAVHRAGIVHRDIKPENIMLSAREGETTQLKLLDFGVAKVTEEQGHPIARLAFPTQEGACIGTPRYASPEQARGAAVDLRTDIYTAGIVLYTLVAGRGPFDEIKGAANVLEAHIRNEPPPPSRFTRSPIPSSLESVILRALAKDPDDRFADAVSFSRALLLTLGKMCLPLDLVASPEAIADALANPRDRVTVAAQPAAQPNGVAKISRAPARAIVPKATRRPQRRAAREAISRAEVLLSAAAFAAATSGVAMWFVR
jgi:serine/threonine protein kinase